MESSTGGRLVARLSIVELPMEILQNILQYDLQSAVSFSVTNSKMRNLLCKQMLLSFWRGLIESSFPTSFVETHITKLGKNYVKWPIGGLDWFFEAIRLRKLFVLEAAVSSASRKKHSLQGILIARNNPDYAVIVSAQFEDNNVVDIHLIQWSMDTNTFYSANSGPDLQRYSYGRFGIDIKGIDLSPNGTYFLYFQCKHDQEAHLKIGVVPFLHTIAEATFDKDLYHGGGIFLRNDHVENFCVKERNVVPPVVSKAFPITMEHTKRQIVDRRNDQWRQGEDLAKEKKMGRFAVFDAPRGRWLYLFDEKIFERRIIEEIAADWVEDRCIVNVADHAGRYGHAPSNEVPLDSLRPDSDPIKFIIKRPRVDKFYIYDGEDSEIALQ